MSELIHVLLGYLIAIGIIVPFVLIEAWLWERWFSDRYHTWLDNWYRRQ